MGGSGVMRRPERMGALLLLGGEVMGHAGCDAVLVADGRVAEIGRADDLGGLDVARRDAVGGAIVPGFVDGHTHLVESGLTSIGWRLDVSGCGRREALERIAAASRLRVSGEWLVAAGWDESCWTPAVVLSRSDLDQAAGRGPVVAIRVDGHLAIANSRALDVSRSALQSRAELVERQSGQVREAAVDVLLSFSRPDAAVIGEAMRASAATCHRLGITTAHVMTGCADAGVVLDAARHVRLRCVVHPPVESLEALAGAGIHTGQGDSWGRWGGLKFFADGSIGARSAAVSEPYESGGRGALNVSTAWLSERIAAAERAGWQTMGHAIGDRAIGQVLDAHRRARSSRSFRHRIEHFELPTAGQIEETARLGLAVCMQPNFVGNWSGPGKLYERALGAARDAASNPFPAVREAGIPLGFGSDGMPLSPLYGIDSAVRAPHETQRMDLDRAVYAYTEGASFLSGDESGCAGVARGRNADLVVLDRRLDTCDIGSSSIVLTCVGGEIVYDAMEDR